MTVTILVVPGDGIGPEVVPAAVRVLEASGADIEIVEGAAGADVIRAHDTPIDPNTLSLVDDVDAVLFGAATTVPGGPSTVLALRRALGISVGVRPARSFAGLGTPGVGITVVRELSEDLYVQDERSVPGGAEAISRITEAATRRAANTACDWAERTGHTSVTVAHKATVLPGTQGLFLDVARDVITGRGLVVADQLADSLAHDIVVDPSTPRLVLAPNVFGDVLSDVASALSGGLGVAPSASFGDGPPLFEPVHGSAPDIAGRGVANPTATILSAALMLDHLDEAAAAQRIRAAVTAALQEEDGRTPDLGGSASTDQFTDAVVDALRTEVVA